MKAKFFCLLGVLVILAGAFWIFWNEKRKEKPASLAPSSSLPSPVAKSSDGFGKLIKKESYEKFVSNDPIENWPIYKNTSFNYQIDYPPEFSSWERGSTGTGTLDVVDFMFRGEGKVFPAVEVKVLSASFDVLRSEAQSSKSYFHIEDLSVGGSSGFLAYYKNPETGEERGIVIFPSKDGKYSFRITTISEFESKEYREVFEKMISSFSFVD